jgi:SAM-dependent methyltransferase
MLLTILLILFAAVLTFFILPAAFLLATSIIGSGAPFVPVPKKAVPGIVEALKLQESAVVYDMGCGDGRVLLACARQEPSIRAVGIEKALLPFLLAKIRTHGTGIEIRRKNFFNENLKDATRVVTYLFPTLMGRVEEKLSAELREGARLVTIDFPLPKKQPQETVEQHIPGLKRGTDLNIYVF